LSRTFSCTPHCWPQKQQCVLTSRSGSALVERRTPAMADRCGPNRSMIFSGSTGIVATMPLPRRGETLRQLVAPRPSLRQRDARPPAARTDLLIMFRARIHLVGEPELPFDDGEVAHHHRRGIRLAAAAAERLVSPRSGVLVEADPDLRRPLEDVEEFPE